MSARCFSALKKPSLSLRFIWVFRKIRYTIILCIALSIKWPLLMGKLIITPLDIWISATFFSDTCQVGAMINMLTIVLFVSHVYILRSREWSSMARLSYSHVLRWRSMMRWMTRSPKGCDLNVVIYGD